jgi:hypothetical protein
VVPAVLVAGLALTGCGKIGHALANAALNVVSPKHRIVENFTKKIRSGESASYEVTYVTTGAAPATITYAALPPNDFYFSGGSSARLIQNSTGDYACTPGAGGSWSCAELTGANFNTEKAAYGLYSGAYWLTGLEVYSTVAGLAGVNLKSSTMTVNGFPLTCMIVGPSKQNTGTSTWCVTNAGVLGYVQLSAKGTAFEIKSYDSSPPPSLFAVPAGATITTIPKVPTTTG